MTSLGFTNPEGPNAANLSFVGNALHGIILTLTSHRNHAPAAGSSPTTPTRLLARCLYRDDGSLPSWSEAWSTRRCSQPPAARCQKEEHPQPGGPKATTSLPSASGKAGPTICLLWPPPLLKGFGARMCFPTFPFAQRRFPSCYLPPDASGRCQVDAAFPGPTTTCLSTEPSRRFSSSLQDVQSHQDFPAPSPRIDAALAEPQPGMTRHARQRLLLALCVLPDVQSHPVSLPLARGVRFGCTGVGRVDEGGGAG